MTLLPEHLQMRKTSGGLGGPATENHVSDYSMADIFGDAPSGPALEDYRCVYVQVSSGATLTLGGAGLSLSDVLGPASYAVAPDPSGIGEGAQVIPAVTVPPGDVRISDLRSGVLSHGNPRSLVHLHGDHFASFGQNPKMRLWRYLDTRQIQQIADRTIEGTAPLKAAAYTGSKIIWFDDDNVLRDADWANAIVANTRTVTGWPRGSPPEAMTYDRARDKLIACDGSVLITLDYDAAAGTVSGALYDNSSLADEVEALVLVPGTDTLVFIYRDDLTMHWAQWDPATGRLGSIQDITAALPLSVGNSSQTAMAITRDYLLYHVDIIGNDLRSYELASGLSFGQSADLGDLAPNTRHPVWLRRTVPAGASIGPAGATLTISGDDGE